MVGGVTLSIAVGSAYLISTCYLIHLARHLRFGGREDGTVRLFEHLAVLV